MHLTFGTQVLMCGNQSLGKWILRKLLGMTLPEKLSRCLAKLGDLHFEGNSFYWIVHAFKVDATLISHGMEEVQVLNRSLLMAKDQVNPEMKVVADVFTFQGGSMLLQEVLWGSSPVWQLCIIYSLSIGADSEV